MGDEKAVAVTNEQTDLPVTWASQEPIVLNPYNNIAAAPFDDKALMD